MAISAEGEIGDKIREAARDTISVTVSSRKRGARSLGVGKIAGYFRGGRHSPRHDASQFIEPDEPSECGLRHRNPILRRRLPSINLAASVNISRWKRREVCRVVAQLEARRKESDIQPLVENLQDIVLKWRK